MITWVSALQIGRSILRSSNSSSLSSTVASSLPIPFAPVRSFSSRRKYEPLLPKPVRKSARDAIMRFEAPPVLSRSPPRVPSSSSPASPSSSATSTSPSSSSSSEPSISRRKLFQQIPVDPDLLTYIKANGLSKHSRVRGESVDRSRLLRIQSPAFVGQLRPKLTLTASASSLEEFPAHRDLPEVAFAGRSNCGKSSLINALAGRFNVAPVSSKPGHTQSLNFYDVGVPSTLTLVDFPGHGFAFAEEAKKESWNALIKEYVSSRRPLKRVCVLCDARHGPKVQDIEFFEVLNSHDVKFQVILTKCDLVAAEDLARRVQLTREKIARFKSVVWPVLMVSSKTQAGLEDLRKELQSMMIQLKRQPLM